MGGEVILNERYADSIIKNPADYDGIEIHGVRNLNAPDDPAGTMCEVDDETPEFFSVYAHCVYGGVECIGDFGTRALAEQYGREIAQKYGWPVTNYAQARVANISDHLPNEWQQKHQSLHPAWTVDVYAGEQLSSTHYVSFALGSPDGTAELAKAAVAEKYAGDWRMECRGREVTQSLAAASPQLFEVTYEATGYVQDKSLLDAECTEDAARGFTDTCLAERTFPPGVQAVVKGHIAADDGFDDDDDIRVFVSVTLRQEAPSGAAIESMPLPEDLLTKVADLMGADQTGEVALSLEDHSWEVTEVEEVEPVVPVVVRPQTKGMMP